MIRAGSVFITSDKHRHVDDHLWIVISDPTQNRDKVFIANLTTYRGDAGHDDCVLTPAQYTGLDHKSCVFFQGARLCRLELLEKSLELGLIELRDPLPDEIFGRVRDAAESTHFASGEAKELLRQQAPLDWGELTS